MPEQSAEMNVVLERLGRLERYNRRLKASVLLLGLGVGAAFLSGEASPGPETVRAQRFEVVDAGGKVWATLGLEPHQQPRLEFLGPRGNRREELGVWNDSPSLELWGAGGSPLPLVALDMGATGSTPELEFTGADASVRIGVWRTYNEDFGLPNSFGYTGPLPRPRQIGLKIFDNGAHSLAELATGPELAPSLTLFDQDGRRLAFGRTTLTTLTPGRSRQSPTSSITAFDRTGRVLAQWPAR